MPRKKLILDENQKQLVINMFKLHYDHSEISQTLGITERTFRRYLKRRENALFSEKCEQARLLGSIQVREALHKAARDGDVQAIKWWQVNLDKETFADISKREITGPNGGPIELQVGNKSDRELVDYVMQAIKEGLIEDADILESPKPGKPVPKQMALLPPPDR